MKINSNLLGLFVGIVAGHCGQITVQSFNLFKKSYATARLLRNVQDHKLKYFGHTATCGG